MVAVRVAPTSDAASCAAPVAPMGVVGVSVRGCLLGPAQAAPHHDALSSFCTHRRLLYTPLDALYPRVGCGLVCVYIERYGWRGLIFTDFTSEFCRLRREGGQTSGRYIDKISPN